MDPGSPVSAQTPPCGGDGPRVPSLSPDPTLEVGGDPLEVRPPSISPNPVESREVFPNSTVSLNAQRHPENLPEVTGTSRGNPGILAKTRERS